MARWRLTEPHYILTADSTKWEYQETDRVTGRQKRVAFEVPRYIHPDDPAEWTEMEGRDFGYVVVSDGHNAQPRDIIFRGEPTPAMICLDDEAKAISAKYSDIWQAANQMLMDGEAGWAMKMADRMLQQVEKISTTAAGAPVAQGMDQFMGVMSKILEQQQTMMMHMMGKSLGVEPVVDQLEPLPPAASGVRRRL